MDVRTSERNELAAAIKERLANTRELPVMPEVAHDLLRLRNHPDADVHDLVKIVQRDPSLAAQVIRYAQLAIFGLGQRITSIEEAITITLGFESALHMTLGIAAGQCLHTPDKGRLGRSVVWEHLLITGALSQELAGRLPRKKQPCRGLCYLAGLLHDFGLLLLGHWYPEHYARLSSLVATEPELDIRELELLVFGISHDNLGRDLMRAWNMPEEIIVATGEHHFPEYGGEHSTYVKIVALANRLHKHPVLEHKTSNTSTAALLKELELTQEQATEALEKVKESMEGLSSLAKQLTG